MDGKNFGRRVRAYRKLKRLQQTELASRLGISSSIIGRIERGTKIPDIALIEKIAEQLEVNIQELIGVTAEKEESE